MPTTRAQLLDLLAHNEESSVLEFKRDDVEPHALAKVLVAFANFDGGLVLLGVDDDRSVTGVTRPNIREWVSAAARDLIRPELVPRIEVLHNVEPGRHVAVVHVTRGYTTHSLWRNGHHQYYIRVADTNRSASHEELQRLFQQRGHFRAEMRPVSGTTLDDLDPRRLTDYFTRVREQPVPAADDVEGWEQLGLNTELLVKDYGRPVATIAGLLLFGRNVNKFIPQAGIDAVAFPGTEKDYATIERAELRGPLVALLSGRKAIDTGLVEDAVAFVRRNTRVLATFQDGARRVERRAYPEDAIREALVNALVHRDYLLSGTNVELSIYDDRLEIISPGRLPNGITPTHMAAGCRVARNQLLKDVMRDYGYMEHLGMGVPRRIIRGMEEHNGTTPDLIEDGERFTVRLWR